MNIKTEFSCGDLGWVYGEHGPTELTIGQVRVMVTNSTGYDDSMFDNYKPQRDYEEAYMCVETGIGSGSVYTLGKHIFRTREQCAEANVERIAEQKRQREAQQAYENRRLLEREREIRADLARIEAIKAAP